MFEWKISRSISTPVGPNFIETKNLKRSSGMEKSLNSEDEYVSQELSQDDEEQNHDLYLDYLDESQDESQTDEESEEDEDEENKTKSKEQQLKSTQSYSTNFNSGETKNENSSMENYSSDKKGENASLKLSHTINKTNVVQNASIQDIPKNSDEDFLSWSSIRGDKRLITKKGYQNVKFTNIPKLSIRYCQDLITTLIDLQWSYVLWLFSLVFIGSWFFFGVLWYLIAKAHGDLDFDPITGNRLGEGKRPCVRGVSDMTGMFIHSFEIQTTVGFGEKYPTEECPEAIFLFVFQIIISIGFEGALVAIIYAKLARPVTFLSKFTFSKNMCVYLRDARLCLVFRVCDPREQKSIATKIRIYYVQDRRTREGETVKVNKELIIEGNGTQIITWPETVCHIIDEKSPFYNFASSEFNSKNYELFVSLVGHSSITGQATESKTSYLPQDVLWGQRFINVIMYDPIKECYVIDYKNFHTTIAVDMPLKRAHHKLAEEDKRQ